MTVILSSVTYCLLSPVEQGHDHSSPPSSVLCCHLHLSPAVPEVRCPHFLLQISFQVFLGRPLPLQPHSVYCSTSLRLLLSLLRCVTKSVPFSFFLVVAALLFCQFSSPVLGCTLCLASEYLQSFTAHHRTIQKKERTDFKPTKLHHTHLAKPISKMHKIKARERHVSINQT